MNRLILREKRSFCSHSFSIKSCFVVENGRNASEMAVLKSFKGCVLQGGALSCPCCSMLHTSSNMFTLLASGNNNKMNACQKYVQEHVG